MAMKRTSRKREHTFENTVPSPCLYPVADPRGMTTASPLCGSQDTTTKHFDPKATMDKMLNFYENDFCFDSQTNGKLRAGNVGGKK